MGEPACGHSDMQIKINVFDSYVQGMRDTGYTIDESDAFNGDRDSRRDESDVIAKSPSGERGCADSIVELPVVTEDVYPTVSRNGSDARDGGLFSARV